MLEWYEIFYALQVAAAGFAFVGIMQDEGMIFEKYGDLLDDLERKNPRWKWVTKPLGNCIECTTGQLALWIFLYLNWWDYILCDPVITILKHILFISVAIVASRFYKNICNKW